MPRVFRPRTRAGTGSTSRTSVPKPSTVTASSSAKRIRVKQAGDLEEALADPGARLQQIRWDYPEPAFSDSAELPGLPVPSQVGEREHRVGGGDVDVGVEPEQSGDFDRG